MWWWNGGGQRGGFVVFGGSFLWPFGDVRGWKGIVGLFRAKHSLFRFSSSTFWESYIVGVMHLMVE